LIRLSIVAAAVLAAACVGAPQAPGRATDSRPVQVVVENRPPTGKDVIDALLASAAIELAVSPTCSNVGTEPTDRTIGRYLAGFMAEMSREDAHNWIETSIEPGPEGAGEPVWRCRVTLRHRDNVDRWGWGVAFDVRQRDGVVLEKSFVCTGAG
jgi:hypothetical protein